jgi:hypothetical protein
LSLSKNIDIHQTLDLTDIQRTNLESRQKLLDAKAIGFNVLLELPLLTDKRIDFGNGKLHPLLRDVIITLNETLDLTSEQINNLDALADKLLPLLKSKWITFDVLKDPQLDLLKNPKLDVKTHQASFFLLIKNNIKEIKHHSGTCFFKLILEDNNPSNTMRETKHAVLGLSRR